jgi:hypothetical protein
MNIAHSGLFLALLSSIAMADPSLPATPASSLPSMTAPTAPEIDAHKPTAMLIASPQGALMLTPEMVDKIVRAQTPEYLHTIPGTPAPVSIGSPSAPPVRVMPQSTAARQGNNPAGLWQRGL